MTELECVSGQTTVIKSQKTELNRTIEELELALKAKEEVRSVWRGAPSAGMTSLTSVSMFGFQELERLKAEVESANEFKFQKDALTQKLKVSTF